MDLIYLYPFKLLSFFYPCSFIGVYIFKFIYSTLSLSVLFQRPFLNVNLTTILLSQFFYMLRKYSQQPINQRFLKVLPSQCNLKARQDQILWTQFRQMTIVEAGQSHPIIVGSDGTLVKLLFKRCFYSSRKFWKHSQD